MSEGPSVVVTVGDPVADAREARRAEAAARAAVARAAHVVGLENELGYLQRQPTVNEARVAQVRAQLDRFAPEPSTARVETAAAVPTGPAAAPTAPVQGVAGPEAPVAPAAPVEAAAAKKAPAKPRARKTAAKK